MRNFIVERMKNEIMKEFDVIAFIDDDLQNCEMAKELEILSLRRV